KKQIKIFFTLAKSAVVSAALTAWLLIPTIFALLQGKFTIPDDRITAFGIGDIIAKLFIGSYDNVGNISAPYIYCGAAAVVLFCGILFLKNKNIKEKIADLFVAAVLLLSMWFVPLNKVWHMFAAPNAFPYRFTFVFAFFILWKGAEFVSAEVNKEERRWFAAFAGALLAVICFIAFKQGAVSTVKIAVTFVIAMSVVVLYFIYRITGKKFVLLVMALAMAGDMALNAYSLIGANYDMLEKYPAEVFEENYNTIQRQLDEIGKEGFYRIFCVKNAAADGADYTENTGFRHGFNEMYRAFTSLTEVEYDAFRGDIMGPADKKIVRVVTGTKYRINKQQITENEETVFPVIYKTPDRPQQTDDFVAYIEDVTGQYVLNADGKPDEAALDAAGRIAQSNGAENFVQKRNKITAVINPDTDNQFVATSIVWDDGWTIKVNGEKKVKHRVLNNLMGFYVHTGENTIEMTYTPKGFYAGVAVTGAAILLCALSAVIKKKKLK
ncbi:MAG: YfhO family protein, partial [Oscillospiraceae bacterium]|nr:YfhO family protein [Oscillospiraceae bacterium]